MLLKRLLAVSEGEKQIGGCGVARWEEPRPSAWSSC